MLWIAALAALGGACSNAVGSILQKRSAGHPRQSELFGRKLMADTVKQYLWIVGTGLDLLGFLLQAFALYFGSLVLVEPLLTADLIIVFFIIHFKYGASSGWREWGGVLMACLGLAALLTTASPHDGRAAAWPSFALIAACVFVVVVFAVITMRRANSSRFRVIVGAAATGVNFSLTAIFTKLAMADLSHGIIALVTGWALYAVILSAISALYIMQNTYVSGSLRLSQPIITISGPAMSVLISFLLFNTNVHHSIVAITIEVAAGIVLSFGVGLLASSRRITEFEAV